MGWVGSNGVGRAAHLSEHLEHHELLGTISYNIGSFVAIKENHFLV
jgi:hypothetical protein